MATNPPNWNPNTPGDPNAPYDPTNVNDPRYDASRDPRYDPRWQKAQQRFYRDQQRAAAGQDRAAQRAQAAAWKAQTKAQRDQWKMYWRGQRRSSIIGPLLLIAVGVAFYLVHSGRVPMLEFVSWYSRFWPLLLIIIGLLRLAEWAIDRARQPQDAPPMRYNVGGGLVTGVIFLAAVGLMLHAGAHWRADRNGLGFFGRFGGGDMDHLFGQKHEEEQAPMVRDIVLNGALSIDNPHGDVTISGTSDDGKVHVSAHKEVYSNSDSTASDRLGQLQFGLEGPSDSMTLRVPAVESAVANITLLVPPTTRLLLNSNHGDVHVSNMKSAVAVTANNGDVEVAAITGNVQVHANNRHRDVNVRSVTGDVTIDGSGDEVTLSDISGSAAVHGDFYSGGHMQHIGGAVNYHSSRSDVSFTRLNGELQIDGNDLTANEAIGPLRISTRSRNISLDKVTGDISITNNHGDVDVHVAPPTGAITVDNQNGNVNLTLPEKARFTLTAETSDGDTHSDFQGSDTHGGHGMLSGSFNGGGAAVKLNTSHGDINVNHNSIAALPPAPPALHLSVPTPPAPPSVPSADWSNGSASEAVADAKKQAQEAIREANVELEDAKRKRDEALKQAHELEAQARASAKQARDAEAEIRAKARQ
jgi:DUF4097 and DUF4098 domain-containing protein YvlB